MGRHENHIILHKNEWQRLKSQGTASRKDEKPSEKNEYLKNMMEMSQNWIKKWPDTLQSHISELEKQRSQQHAKDIAMIKLLKEDQSKTTKNERVDRAKQMIFENSCYGRQLISALLESKTLEERDVQIEFQKKNAENYRKWEQKYNTISDSLQNSLDMEDKEKELIIRKRETAKCIAEINKKIYLSRIEKQIKEKERQKQERNEVMMLMKTIIDQETAENKNNKILQKGEIERFIADHQRNIKNREKTEKEEERRAKQWQEYQDKKNVKIATIHRKRFDAPQSTKNYEIVKKLKEEEKSRYDEFINKGIIALKKRTLIQDNDDNLIRENYLKNNYLLNKRIVENKQVIDNNQNKDTCDRQSLFVKSKNTRKIKAPFKKVAATSASTNAKVSKNVRTRENESTHWSGLSAAHAQFAQQASETLQVCRYKNMARKVVNEYRRLNCLSPQSLPIKNYD